MPTIARAPARQGLSRLAVALATVAAACGPSAVRAKASDEPRPSTATGDLPGTYDLAVCRGHRCAPRDSAAAYLLATLVLFDSAGAVRADLPPTFYERGKRSTGCFLVRYRRRGVDSYAGGLPREYFARLDSGDVVRFPLYRSPDAGYVAELRRTPTGLAGGGTSWGWGVTEIHAPRDTIVAIRRGPPDRLRCHTPETAGLMGAPTLRV